MPDLGVSLGGPCRLIGCRIADLVYDKTYTTAGKVTQFESDDQKASALITSPRLRVESAW